MGTVASILFLTTITFFFTSNFWSDKKPSPINETDNTIIEEPITTVRNTINFDDILADTSRMDSLIAFAKASKYITAFEPEISWKDSLNLEKNYKSVKKKSAFLEIDITILDNQYASKKQIIESVLNKILDNISEIRIRISPSERYNLTLQTITYNFILKFCKGLNKRPYPLMFWGQLHHLNPQQLHTCHAPSHSAHKYY